jgi:hypothetical protein
VSTAVGLHVSVWTQKRKSIFHQVRDIFETANRKGVGANCGSVHRDSIAAGKPKAGGKTNPTVKWSPGRHSESKVSGFPNQASALHVCVCAMPHHIRVSDLAHVRRVAHQFG